MCEGGGGEGAGHTPQQGRASQELRIPRHIIVILLLADSWWTTPPFSSGLPFYREARTQVFPRSDIPLTLTVHGSIYYRLEVMAAVDDTDTCPSAMRDPHSIGPPPEGDGASPVGQPAVGPIGVLSDDFFPVFSQAAAATAALHPLLGCGKAVGAVADDAVTVGNEMEADPSSPTSMEGLQHHVVAYHGECLSAADEDDSAASLLAATPPRRDDNNDTDEGSREQITAAARWWPHTPVPPSAAHPAARQSRVGFHRARYGAFVKCYAGLTDEATERAQRLGRGICVIGVRACRTRGSSVPSLVRVTRAFLRHSVIAVENDAVFNDLIARAEWFTVHRMQRLSRAAARWEDPPVANPDGADVRVPLVGPPPSPRWPQPRHSETLSAPNARCIALRYGGVDGAPEGAPYQPTVTLLAIICTSRLAAGDAVRVCADSYHRCLDEASWYAQRYASRPETQTCANDSWNSLQGTVCGGLKQFHRWPQDLPYYHGVGARHSSTVAAAGFPFTLLNLSPAPDLGAGEMGVTAAAFIPYATCFLYTGPSVATTRVEKLILGSPPSVGGKKPGGPTAAAARPQQSAASTGVKRDASSAENPTDEDISFARDDTYALGLGRHGVCFGQGLTRYINHRYNTSRFGNVELASVMLSVPSEFSTLLKANGKVIVPPSRRRSGNARRSPRSTPRKPHTQRRRHGAPVLFLEEHSHLLTVPFFLTTTDIEPGASLLAWTYGEAYDAKLERVAVADGALVPYADGVLLNARPLMGLSNPWGMRCWQRYSGDYRFALGVGDVVWRRRPSRDGRRCRLPEEDLFVVVQTMRRSTERVLLRPLQRIALGEDELATLLVEQELAHYSSPFASGWAAGQSREDDVDDASVILGARLYSRSPSAKQAMWRAVTAVRGGSRAVSAGRRLGSLGSDGCGDCATVTPPTILAEAHRLQEAWGVFDTSATATDTASRLPELAHCVIATTDTVGLLLADVDYTIARQLGTRAAKGPSAPSRHRIVINLDDLRHSTSMVRHSARAGALPPLINGFLWPLVRNQPMGGSAFNG